MAKYVVLTDWTDQGVRNAKDTVTRYEQAREALQQLGVSIEAVYWTLGRYDLVVIVEAPDDAIVTAALLRLASGGNVSTETLRAFSVDEMRAIVQQVG
jgi:uncharacterized protein with GYD domain